MKAILKIEEDFFTVVAYWSYELQEYKIVIRYYNEDRKKYKTEECFETEKEPAQDTAYAIYNSLKNKSCSELKRL